MSVLSAGAVRRSICSAWDTLWNRQWRRARLPPQAATGPFRPSAGGHLSATGAATSGLCAESSQPYRRRPGRARTGTGLSGLPTSDWRARRPAAGRHPSSPRNLQEGARPHSTVGPRSGTHRRTASVRRTGLCLRSVGPSGSVRPSVSP